MPIRRRRRRNETPNPRRRRRAAPRRNENPRRRRRSNPALIGGGGKIIGGVAIGTAAKTALSIVIGMFAAKFAAKRWGGNGEEGDDWTWKNYAWGLGGGLGAAIAARALFGARGAPQNVMVGAFGLVLYKMLINEVFAKSRTLLAWFGAEEEPLMIGAGENDETGAQLPVSAGTISQGQDGRDFVLGQDGMWRPIDESHRLPGYVGDEVVPVDPTMGDEVVPVDPTLGSTEDLAAQFKRAYTM